MYTCMYVRREVEVIDLAQSQSSDESVSSFMFDDEHYGGTIHGFDEVHKSYCICSLWLN